MSIHVALIDKSEIVKKMLSHCLYYFSAEISRFDSFEDNASYFTDKKPDIVFVDWDIKQGDKSVVYSVIEKMKPTAVVLLYRSLDHAQINDIPFDEIPHRIKKPLDPKMVRDIFIELVPKARESKIHPFLKFPKTEGKKNVPIADTKANTTVPKAGLAKDSKLQVSAFTLPLTDKNKVKERTQTSLNQPSSKKQPSSKVLIKQIQTPKTQLKSTVASKQKELSKAPDKAFVQKAVFDQARKTDQTLTDSEKEKPSIQELAVEKTQTRSKVKKEDINIDETTQNDLAPMAIKSSVSMEESFLKNQNIELSEKSVLRVLNKYKDTLEFQELMEKVLSGYAKGAVENILQDDKVTDLLQQPLSDFKESKKFKELVEQQIIQYVNRHLPLVIKEVVEQEIKKIIGD